MSWLLRIACALSLGGFALGHLFGDPPYRALLWKERYAAPVFDWIGVDYGTLVADPAFSARIDCFASVLGWIFAGLAVGALLPWRGPWGWLVPLLAAPAILMLGLARWGAHAFELVWPPEFAARLVLPLLLVIAFDGGWRPRAAVWYALLAAVSLTFFGHGCYALDWGGPRPLVFVTMLNEALGVGEGSAALLLKLIGVQDILLAVAVWIPALRSTALLWMAVWGGLTALARLVGIDSTFPAATLIPAIADSAERALHFALPFACWVWWRGRDREPHPTPVIDLEDDDDHLP